MKKAMADPQQVELARQGLVANPALLQALGLSVDAASDPQQWAALVQTGVDSLLQLASPAEEQSFGAAGAGDGDLEAVLQQLLKKAKVKGSEEDADDFLSRAA